MSEEGVLSSLQIGERQNLQRCYVARFVGEGGRQGTKSGGGGGRSSVSSYVQVH
jgi:hypothetical protein